MSNKRRAKRLVGLGVGLSLVAMACGGDDEPDEGAATTAGGVDTTAAGEAPDTTSADTEAPDGTTEETTEETTDGTTDDTTDGTGDAGRPSGETVMTLTVNLNPDAVWEDGTPITVADIECTWQAYANTPGSIDTDGYAVITAVTEGESEKQAIVEFSVPYGPYRTLFNAIIKAESVADCNDISGDFSTELPVSGRQYVLQEWSEGQSVLVANENYYGDDAALTPTVVMVPQTDQDTELASILAGQVDYIYPQVNDQLGAALQVENIESSIASGGDFEALYFQQLEGPFADPVFREAFSMSVDRQALFDQIYGPIFAAVGEEGSLLNCGPIGGGPYCPEGNFENTYDPAAAEALLTENGWARDSGGFWAPEGGTAPEIRWMVNAGNTRRENAQAYLIPLLQQAGFNVVVDNGTAEEVFQQRLPALDYDLAMYISTPEPDPSYLTPFLTCDAIPTEENNFQGQNTTGWCNEEASAALEEADVATDEQERIDLVHSALLLTDEDHVLLPLVNYPRSGFWRTDRLAGPIGEQTANYRAFSNFHEWEDVDGDGQLVIGAEQWPGCLNPVTECANSSWSVWTATFPFLPGIWDSTPDQTFEITNLVTEEPTIEMMDGAGGGSTDTTEGTTEDTTEETTEDTEAGATETTEEG